MFVKVKTKEYCFLVDVVTNGILMKVFVFIKYFLDFLIVKLSKMAVSVLTK